ncbi:MAG TPA: inorganic diphosphatase [Myxococcales bacterium]|nr:inorganic diphosphatase [Myxococcales bacterium]
MPALHELPYQDDDGTLRAVVEVPKGSRVKTKWEPELGAMVVGRPLPAGLAYPFDWGFIPGTIAEDGDPLDALILCEDASSWPGVVVPVRAVGLLRIDQKGTKGRQRNDRLVTIPTGLSRWGRIRSVADLSKQMRDEVEKFFLDSTFFTDKDARSRGFAGPAVARRTVERAARAFRDKQ